MCGVIRWASNASTLAHFSIIVTTFSRGGCAGQIRLQIDKRTVFEAAFFGQYFRRQFLERLQQRRAAAGFRFDRGDDGNHEIFLSMRLSHPNDQSFTRSTQYFSKTSSSGSTPIPGDVPR